MPTSPRAVDAEGCLVRTGSTSAERVAVDRRRDSAKARDGVAPFNSRGKRSRCSPHHARARNPKPLVLAAFFGYFLSLVAESTPAGGIYRHKGCAGRNPPAAALPWPWGRELRIATGAARPRNDRGFCKGCGGFPTVRRGGAPPLPRATARVAPTEGLQGVQGAGRCRHRPLRKCL